MEKFCLLRDIYRSIREFEIYFQQTHDLCLNEGMALCSLKKDKLSSSDIASTLGLTNSNASKVIKSIEEKGFVERLLGKDDKRQMYFELTESGKAKLKEIQNESDNIDKVLLQIGCKNIEEESLKI